MNLSTLQDITERLVKDEDNRLLPNDVSDALRAAITKFSSVKPYNQVVDLVGDGTDKLTLPDTWLKDFSKMNFIHRDVSEFEPTPVATENYKIVATPDGDVLQLRDWIAVNEVLRISFTTVHHVTNTTSTIADHHQDAISMWAAARLLDQLAALYSGDSDSTISADSVDHNSKGREYAARARNYRQQFYNEIGIDPKRNIAAGVVVDLDKKDSQGGTRLQHSERFR